MALIANITSDELWYLGEDKTLRFVAYEDAAQTVALDVSGFALSWKLALKPGATPVLTKTTGAGITISGVFDASPAVNTQRVLVAVADTDTDGLLATTWWQELKRTDAGLEGVLAHGSAKLLKPVHSS